MKANGPIQNVDVEILPWLELESFADFFGNYDLKFGRNLDSIHSISPIYSIEAQRSDGRFLPVSG